MLTHIDICIIPYHLTSPIHCTVLDSCICMLYARLIIIQLIILYERLAGWGRLRARASFMMMCLTRTLARLFFHWSGDKFFFCVTFIENPGFPCQCVPLALFLRFYITFLFVAPNTLPKTAKSSIPKILYISWTIKLCAAVTLAAAVAADSPLCNNCIRHSPSVYTRLIY